MSFTLTGAIAPRVALRVALLGAPNEFRRLVETLDDSHPAVVAPVTNGRVAQQMPSRGLPLPLYGLGVFRGCALHVGEVFAVQRIDGLAKLDGARSPAALAQAERTSAISAGWEDRQRVCGHAGKSNGLNLLECAAGVVRQALRD